MKLEIDDQLEALADARFFRAHMFSRYSSDDALFSAWLDESRRIYAIKLRRRFQLDCKGVGVIMRKIYYQWSK